MSEFKGKTIKENVEVLKGHINNSNELYKSLEKVTDSLNKSITNINDQRKEFNKFSSSALNDINAFTKDSIKEFDSFSTKTTKEISNLNNRITNFEAQLGSIALKQNEVKSLLDKIEHQIQEEKTNSKHRNTINRIIITTGFIFAITVPIILYLIMYLSK